MFKCPAVCSVQDIQILTFYKCDSTHNMGGNYLSFREITFPSGFGEF